MNSNAKRFAKALLLHAQNRAHRLFTAKRAASTNIFTNILHSMARQNGHKFHPYAPRKRKEFLCDFAWVRWDKSHPPRIENLILAAECEWITKPKSVAYDFRKLIPLKAPLKLCIYQIRKNNSQREAAVFMGEISKALEAYRQHARSETFLLLELHRKGNHLQLHYWSAPQDGANQKVKFHRFE